MMRNYLSLLILFALTAGPAQADPLAIASGWVRESIPGQNVTVAYLEIANSGAQNCQLTGGKSVAAERVEIHEHQHQNGQMRMRQLAALDVPAGATRTFKPGGLHLMLIGLHRPLAQGEDVAITLISGDCGDISATLPVARMN